MSSTAIDPLQYRVVPSARWKKSPLFWEFRRAGATGFGVYNHTLYAVDYANQSREDEYSAVKTGVVLWDVSAERPTELTGPDAVQLMDLITPRDMRSCEIGQCKYALICDENGGIINDPVVLRLDEDRFWLCPSDSDLHLWMKGVRVGMGLDVEIRLTDVYGVQIQGPKSPDVLRVLAGDGVMSLRYYYCVEADIGEGIPTVITRTGWTGEVGFEIFLADPSRTPEFFECIVDAGRDFGMIPAAPNHIRRVEAGILNYQADMDLTTNPYEVGLGWQVDLGKDRFIGKDALTRASQHIGRKLVGLEIQGERPPLEFQERWPIVRNQNPIGSVTMAVYSPTLDKNIALGIIDIAYSGPGGDVEVERAPSDQRSIATVVNLPFVDPSKTVPKTALSANPD